MSRLQIQFLAMCMKLLNIEETILSSGEITAVLVNLLGSAPGLEYCAHNNHRPLLSVAGQIFCPDKYSFCFQHCWAFSHGYVPQILDLRGK